MTLFMTTSPEIRKFKYEQDLVFFVARYLRNRSFRKQLTEVPFFEYRIDMYGYSRLNDQTVAIELKLKRWSRAIEQALLYQLCSDLVYIAMPSYVTDVVELRTLNEYGLGLLSVDTHQCRQIHPARPSLVLRKHYREKYLALVSGSL